MTDTPGLPLDEDVVVGVILPTRGARGRVTRLTKTVDAILGPHAYPERIERLLAEALALTALFGSLLKDEKGQITMQAQTQGGIVELLVCDWLAGELRGHVKYDGDRLAEAGPDVSLGDLFGKGFLAITFDQPSRNERYQGIAPIEGATLGEVAQSYFAQSEQIPSLVRIHAERVATGWRVGALMLQHLPEGEEGRERLHTKLDHPDWPHVAILGGSVKDSELVDTDLTLDALVWRLFHEEDEVRLSDPVRLAKGCRCSPDYIASVIARFPVDERKDMVAEDGMIRVDCAFCATSFPIDPDAVADTETDEAG
ncbi:Hsp33 family molecular chaperone HslO [Sphingomicrobium sp. XHP0239]|uniref:Hsp33 family molecular chaperone HslO n=1 Tax=Sphingomicrobium maritimum TaxID=3133972 RepID=UPI0031CCC97D